MSGALYWLANFLYIGRLGAALAFHDVEFDAVVFGNRLGKVIDVEEDALACHPIVDKAIALGLVVVRYAAGTHAIVFHVFKLRRTDQYFVCGYRFELLGVGRCISNIAIFIHIGEHIVQRLAFV